jgi:hypothetical protein
MTFGQLYYTLLPSSPMQQVSHEIEEAENYDQFIYPIY